MLRMKQDLGALIWDDVKAALGQSVPPERLATQAELLQAFNVSQDIVGVFPVGAPLAEANSFDIRFSPSLTAFRVNSLIKQHICPALKEAGGQLQCWIPLPRRRGSARFSLLTTMHLIPQSTLFWDAPC